VAAPSITNCWKYATASGVSGTVNGFATVTADRCAVVGTVNFSAGPASLLISDQLNGAYGIVARDHQGSFCSVGAFVQPALVGGAINLSWASASNGGDEGPSFASIATKTSRGSADRPSKANALRR